MHERTLVLMRHGQSAWNLENRFTGWRDPDLTARGEAEAIAAGRQLKKQGISFHAAYTSALKRARRSLQLLLREMDVENLPVMESAALNERDYGNLSGMNKSEANTKWGEAQVRLWRRSYESVPPGGESLKKASVRVTRYYLEHIRPNLLPERPLLIVAHGNSLRALIMKIEALSAEQVTEVEVDTGVPILYRLDSGFSVLSKDILWKTPKEELDSGNGAKTCAIRSERRS